jgi:UDP-glucose 4-epimerase
MSASAHPFASARVLVTGACGFIGTHVARRLAEMGAVVTGLSRRADLPVHWPADARLLRCDLTKRDQAIEAVQAVEPRYVFHLAAHPDGPENCQHTHAIVENNVMGVANLLEALVGLPAVTLVYADSAKVYGNTGVPYRMGQAIEPLSTYAVSKAAGWGLVDVYRRIHGVRAVGLRPTLVYGPGQGFNLFTFLAKAVASGRREIELAGGAQTRDPLYIDDAVDAFVAAALRAEMLNGSNLPIGGGRELSVLDVAECAIRVWGGGLRVVCCPTAVRPTETMRSGCDNEDARRALGWSPAIDLEEGLRRTAAYLGLSATAAPLAQLH